MKIKLFLVFAITFFMMACEKEPTEKTEDLCENVTCLNNGVCVDGNCDCLDGFSGTNCETEIVTDPCATINCQNNGTCIDGTCECPPNYSGTLCQLFNQPDSISIYRIEFDYWYCNSQQNYSYISDIEYSINNVDYHYFDNLGVSSSNFSIDYPTPILIPLPKDKLMTFKVHGGCMNYEAINHSVLLDGGLDFELENINTEIYTLTISKSNGDAYYSNGEFRFKFYCKLHYD